MHQQNPHVYTSLQEKALTSEWNDIIRKDIPRTFRHHSMFSESESQGADDLFNVLSTFSVYQTKIGERESL